MPELAVLARKRALGGLFGLVYFKLAIRGSKCEI